jgi:hypothetical protein
VVNDKDLDEIYPISKMLFIIFSKPNSKGLNATILAHKARNMA